ncbi:MAG: hypothetical protein NTV10_00570 [Methanoregula sp.]|nr:hypothetical protein [Methanoregula sp.]
MPGILRHHRQPCPLSPAHGCPSTLIPSYVKPAIADVSPGRKTGILSGREGAYGSNNFGILSPIVVTEIPTSKFRASGILSMSRRMTSCHVLCPSLFSVL